MTAGQTPSADENCVIWLKAPEQLLNGPFLNKSGLVLFICSLRSLVCFRVHPVGPEEPEKEAGFKQAEGAERRRAPPTGVHAADSRRPAGRLQPQSLQGCRQRPLQSCRLQDLQE